MISASTGPWMALAIGGGLIVAVSIMVTLVRAVAALMRRVMPARWRERADEGDPGFGELAGTLALIDRGRNPEDLVRDRNR